MDTAALQECVAGFSAAARPLQKTLDGLLQVAHASHDKPLDGSTLRSALAQETARLDQQKVRCAWLQRQCLLLHKASAWHERLANSLPDDAFVVKDAIADLTPIILSESSSASDTIADHPRAVTDAGIALMQELAGRCKACWSRHMDLRAGNFEPMLDYAARIKGSRELAEDTSLNTDKFEDGEEQSLFHFPHFLLSHARAIDRFIMTLKPDGTANTVEQLFQAYVSQVQSVIKKQFTERSNKAKEDLASISSTTASLRVLSELLDSLTEEVNRLWILTATVFSQYGPAGNQSPGYDSNLLNASYEIPRHALASLTQQVGDAAANAILPVLKAVTSKSTRTQVEALQNSFELLKKFISFYGDPYGPLYLTVLQLRDEMDPELFAQAVLAALEEQQPLREAVSLVLKAMKSAIDDPAMSAEFAALQIWNESKDTSTMTKGMIDLFEVCSLVAALSRHTSYRTNSEHSLNQLLTNILRAGQQSKGVTKPALAKFNQYLQRKDEHQASLLGSSPNFLLPGLAKAFYAVHMPSIIPAILAVSSDTATSSTGGTKAKTERSMLV